MDAKILERFERAGGFQSTTGKCVICDRPFRSCKHDVGDMAKVLKAYKAKR